MKIIKIPIDILNYKFIWYGVINHCRLNIFNKLFNFDDIILQKKHIYIFGYYFKKHIFAKIIKILLLINCYILN